MGMKLVQLPCKTVWRLLKKLKAELLYDPAIPLLGIYLKEVKSLSWKNIGIPVFSAGLFKESSRENNLRPMRDDWIKKMWHVYTSEHYLALKRKQVLPFMTTWMDLQGIMLSEKK